MCIDEDTESTDLILKDLQQNYSSRDTIPVINCSLFRQDKSTIQYTYVQYIHAAY
jgi:hypothetical protein